MKLNEALIQMRHSGTRLHSKWFLFLLLFQFRYELWSEDTVTVLISFPKGSRSQSGSLEVWECVCAKEMKCLKGVWLLSVSLRWWSVWIYSAHSPCCTRTSLLKPEQAPSEHQKKHLPWEKHKERIEGGKFFLKDMDKKLHWWDCLVCTGQSV